MFTTKAEKLKKAQKALFDAVKRGSVADMERALREGAKIDVADRYGDSVVMLAERYGQTGIIDHLVQHHGVTAPVKPSDDADVHADLYAASRFREFIETDDLLGAEQFIRDLQGRRIEGLAKTIIGKEAVEDLLSEYVDDPSNPWRLVADMLLRQLYPNPPLGPLLQRYNLKRVQELLLEQKPFVKLDCSSSDLSHSEIDSRDEKRRWAQQDSYHSPGSLYCFIHVSALPLDTIPDDGKIYIEQSGNKLRYLVKAPYEDRAIYGELDSFNSNLVVMLPETSQKGHTLWSKHICKLGAWNIGAHENCFGRHNFQALYNILEAFFDINDLTQYSVDSVNFSSHLLWIARMMIDEKAKQIFCDVVEDKLYQWAYKQEEVSILRDFKALCRAGNYQDALKVYFKSRRHRATRDTKAALLEKYQEKSVEILAEKLKLTCRDQIEPGQSMQQVMQAQLDDIRLAETELLLYFSDVDRLASQFQKWGSILSCIKHTYAYKAYKDGGRSQQIQALLLAKPRQQAEELISALNAILTRREKLNERKLTFQFIKDNVVALEHIYGANTFNAAYFMAHVEQVNPSYLTLTAELAQIEAGYAQRFTLPLAACEVLIRCLDNERRVSLASRFKVLTTSIGVPRALAEFATEFDTSLQAKRVSPALTSSYHTLHTDGSLEMSAPTPASDAVTTSSSSSSHTTPMPLTSSSGSVLPSPMHSSSVISTLSVPSSSSAITTESSSSSSEAPVSLTASSSLSPTVIPQSQPIESAIQMTALYPYTAQRSNELSFVQGQRLLVLDRSNPMWWRCQLGDQIGLVPSGYLSRLAASHAASTVASDSPTHSSSTLQPRLSDHPNRVLAPLPGTSTASQPTSSSSSSLSTDARDTAASTNTDNQDNCRLS